MQDFRVSRDFPHELSDREARHGFEIVGLFRIDDFQNSDRWTRVVAKIRDSSEAIVKLSFRGGVRYQLFRHGYHCMDQSAKRTYWFTVGGESREDFGQVEFETNIEARDDPSGMILVPAEIIRIDAAA